MYVIWFSLGILMVLGYAYSEWRLAQAIMKKVYKNEEVILSGRKSLFMTARFSFAFIGASAFYFGLISFIRAETVPGCWLAPALSVGLLVLFSTSQRTKFLKFEDEIG